jgi:hypothetical protein
MGSQGTTLLDFGAFPGASDSFVSVTGQAAILGSSLAEAYVFPGNTSDHSYEEHILEPFAVFAHNITAGSGFRITGIYQGKVGDSNFIYGNWLVAWVWN